MVHLCLNPEKEGPIAGLSLRYPYIGSATSDFRTRLTMGTALPRVVVILNFNGLRWLEICLPSVVKSTYQNANYYVIDNGSADGSVDFVES